MGSPIATLCTLGSAHRAAGAANVDSVPQETALAGVSDYRDVPDALAKKHGTSDGCQIGGREYVGLEDSPICGIIRRNSKTHSHRGSHCTSYSNGIV